MFFLRVDDEKRAGQRTHVLDTAEVCLELVSLLRELHDFFLGKERELVHALHLVELVESVDPRSDGGEVGQRAAQPASGDVVHAAALRFGGDCLLRLLLRAYEQHGLAAVDDAFDKVIRFVDETDGLFEVDDINIVPRGVDVLLHLGVPLSRGVTEVYTGFQQLFHGNNVCHFCSSC